MDTAGRNAMAGSDCAGEERFERSSGPECHLSARDSERRRTDQRSGKTEAISATELAVRGLWTWLLEFAAALRDAALHLDGDGGVSFTDRVCQYGESVVGSRRQPPTGDRRTFIDWG